MPSNSLPGCIGYYGKPIPPNKCEICPYIDLCRKVVAKERLKIIEEKILELKTVLAGERKVA